MAACTAEDAANFFPVGKGTAAGEATCAAKAVCARCPVRRACGDFALRTNQEYGIWGGMDEEERREIRRSWRKDRQRLPPVQRPVGVAPRRPMSG